MKLDSIKLYNELKKKEVSYLYHADSLTSSIGFICNGGLFSRGEMKIRNIPQTEQKSDDIDKKVNVWNDIFLDTIDLHGYKYSKYYRENSYGPVLFVLKLELLLDATFSNVWITKDNPIKWNSSLEDEKKYFSTVKNYIEKMDVNRQQKMITIRNISKPIPFNKYLEHIELDDPQRDMYKLNVSAYEYAYSVLQYEIKAKGLNANIIKHKCKEECYCIRNYDEMSEEAFNKYFMDYTSEK